MPRYMIVQQQDIPANSGMKPISDVKTGQSESNKPKERIFNTAFEMQQAISEAYGEPVSLVSSHFITGTILPYLTEFKRIGHVLSWKR